VVHSMHGELQPLLEFPIRIKMEDPTVQNILEKGPEKDSSQKQPGSGPGIRSYAQTLVKSQQKVRDENNQHRAGADTAQPLEYWIFEHDQFPATGLKVFRDVFFSVHAQVIYRYYGRAFYGSKVPAVDAHLQSKPSLHYDSLAS